ncbi:MAG: PAS domain S-box protein [Nitratireductor sp.]|nr:PAS domain S-box protein [Nitratireductor sp.]
MPGSRYSFLDLTVLAELRRRVLSPEATILFGDDMHAVLWANAPGAALFGGTDLAELIDLPLGQTQPFVRQLRDAATQIEDGEPLVRGFRVARGLRTEFIQCELSRIHLPAGEEAVLLVCTEDRLTKPAREHELAARAVDSLVGLASAAAIVDDYGLAIAATGNFADIDLAPEDIAILVGEAAEEADRLVKRVAELGDGGVVAVGVARLRDRPGRYLLVCAEAGGETEETDDDATAIDTAEAMDFVPASEPLDEPVAAPEHGDALPEAAIADEHAGPPQAEPVAFDGQKRELVPPEGWEDEEPEEDEPEEQEPEEDGQELAQNPSPQTHEDEETGTPLHEPATLQRKPSLLDRWYLGMSSEADETAATNKIVEDEAEEAETEEPGTEAVSSEDISSDGIDEPAEMDFTRGSNEETSDEETPAGETLSESDDVPVQAGEDDLEDTSPTREREEEVAAQASSLEEQSVPAAFVFSGEGEPVRFAWIIDSDQVFRSVSPELAQTVGPNAADIIGRKWGEVAAVFGFDNTGEIRRQLERRDTWSGKSVLWPVQGTDLVVPIDLAALPAFDATRNFDGFRGFGIIRVSDAVIDPNETGMALVPNRSATGAAKADESAPETSNETDTASERIEERRMSGRTGSAESGWEHQSAPAANVVHLRRSSHADAQEELSRRESQAFNEIGKRLRDGQEGAESARHPQGETQSAQDRGEKAGGLPKSWTETGSGPVEPRFEDKTVDDTGDAGNRDNGTRDASADEDGGSARRGTNSILEQLPVPVLIFRNGVTLFANPELLELTGYGSIDELSRAGGVDALLSGDVEHGQATLICKDGRSMNINPLLQTVPWEDGKALLMSFRPAPGTGEAELPANEKIALDMVRVAELQNILDTATDGIVIVDTQGDIESINASAEALFGIDHAQAAGLALTNLFAQESHKTLIDYMAELTNPGVASILIDGREVIGKEAKGGLIPLFITIGRVGAAEKFCVVLRDMTHWKKAEEELVNAKRAAELASEQKTDFLARVSHEIRTPLNAIIGFSDVMLEERFGPVGNERYREYLRDINRSGVHVLDLINDLLDISKIEAGKMELSYEAVDLNQLAAETVALLQPQANRERIIIRTSLSRAVPRVVADARSIRQIILNLVSNAIKFTPENGQVIVSTVYEGNGEVALRVRDTGKGMSEADIDNAMKPFQQLRGVEEKRGQGTGLGLPLTKALVEANRAYFDLESTPGEGTIAHVHFPTQRVLAD